MDLEEIIAKHSLSFKRKPDEDGSICTLSRSNPEGSFTMAFNESIAPHEVESDGIVTIDMMLLTLGCAINELTDNPKDWDYSDCKDPNEEEDDRLKWAKCKRLAMQLEQIFGRKFLEDLEEYSLEVWRAVVKRVRKRRKQNG